VIPAHGWGGRWARIGARPLLVGRRGWAILLAQQSHDVTPKDMSASGAARTFVEAAPDDACLMSARGLSDALTPVVGEHCTICDDEGERACPCCQGKMALARLDAAGLPHYSVRADGRHAQPVITVEVRRGDTDAETLLADTGVWQIAQLASLDRPTYRQWRYLGPAVRLDVKIATARGVQ